MRRQVLRKSLIIMCMATLISCSTSDPLMNQSWVLLEKRSDPSSRERVRPEIRQQPTIGASQKNLVIDGRLNYEREVDRWNVYVCTENRKGKFGIEHETKRYVVDPIGKPYPNADPLLTADQIIGCPRQPTGLGWAPATLDGKRARISWVIEGENNREYGSGRIPVSRGGLFTLLIDEDILRRISMDPAPSVTVTVSPDLGSWGDQVETNSTQVELRRDLVMDALRPNSGNSGE